MDNGLKSRSPVLRVLLVAEGSGGHLIPALQVAKALAAQGAAVKVWYAARRQTRQLTTALMQEMQETEHVAIDVDPIPMNASANPLQRLWQCGQLWYRAQRCFDAFAPDVVVGFGGWVSAPVIMAARLRRATERLPWRGMQARLCRLLGVRQGGIPSGVEGRRGRGVSGAMGCVLHEQNVRLGRANRWLARWVDQVAVSFIETQAQLNGTRSILTGLPVRHRVGQTSKAQAAATFGWDPDRLTLLVLGGSQGSRAINRLMTQVAGRLSSHERETWQILHVAGSADAAMVTAAYAAHGVTAWVRPFLVEMDAAYAQADLVVARAGASTIAELARCGKPSVLIPYPYAGAHQRANAQVVEAAGGGVMIEEREADPAWVLTTLRRILVDKRLRDIMGLQMRSLDQPNAAERFTDAIMELATR